MDSQKDTKAESKPRRKIVRRHGACTPCQHSKIKCDGKEPCTTCTRSKRKRLHCVYTGKAKRANERRSDHRDSKLIRSGSIGESSLSDTTLQHSRHATPSTISEPGHREGHDAKHFDYMSRPVALSQTVEKYSTLFRPRASCATLLERSQACAQALKDHIHMSPQTCSSFTGVKKSPIRQKRCDRSFTSSSIMGTWDDHLAMLEGWINDGYLDHARKEIQPLQQDIETHLMRKGRASNANRELQEKAIMVLTKLVRLDCKLDLFLGYRKMSSLWTWPGLPNPCLGQMSEENMHAADRIELLQQLQTIAMVKGSENAGFFKHVVKHIHGCINEWQGQPSSQSSCFAFPKLDTTSKECQEQRLFTSLLWMTVYCRMASIEKYCNDQLIRQGQTASADDSVSNANGSSKMRKRSARSAERQTIIKYANCALNAFHQLCHIDGQTTAKCWFRLHGALIAALCVNIARMQKGKAASESSLTETLSTTRECFRNLKEYNPEGIIFEQAESFFEETAKSQRRHFQTTGADSSMGIDLPLNHSVDEVSLVVSNSCAPTFDDEEPVADLQALQGNQYTFLRPPQTYPPTSNSYKTLQPPMALDPAIHPPGEWYIDPTLALDHPWCFQPMPNTEQPYLTDHISTESFVAQSQQTTAYTFPTGVSSVGLEHTRFINVTPENFEADSGAESHMTIEPQRQALNSEQQSKFEDNIPLPVSYYCATSQTSPVEDDRIVSGWQGHFLPQTAATRPEYPNHSSHDELLMQNSSMTYHESADTSIAGIHSIPWSMHQTHQLQIQ